MKTNLANLTRNVRTFGRKHQSEILTGIGIAGMISGTLMAVSATPKALRIIEANSGIDHKGEAYKPTRMEAVKLCWKCYAPAVITEVLSVGCLIGASSVNARRNTALATAYSLSESALKEYTAKVVETIGEKKESAIRDSIAKDKVESNPASTKEIIITDNGDTLCYDAISGRYFKSSIDKINKAVNELNRQMTNEMYVSLNELYYSLGLDGTHIGDELGWNMDGGLIDVNFSAQLADDVTPCIVMDYRLSPRYNYYHLA